MADRRSSIAGVVVAMFALLGPLRAQTSDSLSLSAALATLADVEGHRFSYEASAFDTVFVAVAAAADWISLREQLRRLGIATREEAGGLVVLARRDRGDVAGVSMRRVSISVGDGREPLLGATVRLPDGTGAVSDPQGHVTLTIPGATTRATVSYIGYASAELLLSPEQNDYRVILQPDTVLVSAVEVVGALPDRPWRAVGTRGDDRDAGAPVGLRLPPASLDAMGFSAAAGVSQIDATGSGPAIRGSQGYETRIELDGLPLYHVDHLYGLFSAVNPLSVADVRLYRSHYPVDRGGARGGLMAIETIDPSGAGVTARADQVAGALVAHARAPAVGVLVSARGSFGDVASGTAFESVSEVDSLGSVTARTVPSFTFHDLYGRLDLGREGAAWSGQLNAYQSRDRYGFTFDDSALLEDRRVPRTLQGRYQEDSEWRNAGFGGSLAYRRGRLRYALEGYLSRYTNELATEAAFALERPRRERLVEVAANALSNEVSDAQLGIRVSPAEGAAEWQVGLQAQRLSTVAKFELNERTPLDLDGADVRLHAYAARRWRLPGEREVDLGLRGTYAELTGDAWLSPRVGLVQPLALPSGKTLDLTAGYSFTRQALASLQHENQFGQTYALLVLEAPRAPVVSSAHTITLGTGFEDANTLLTVEGYWRELPGVLATLSTTPGLRNERALFNPQPTFLSVAGEGQVVGVDVDARWRRGDWDGSAAYTLSRSRQRFAAIDDNAWQRAPDDRRHRLALTSDYRLGAWRLGASYEAASGLVFNDISGLDSGEDRRGISSAQLQTSLPAYHRVDAGLWYRLGLGAAEVQFGARVVNLLDRFNVTQRQYVLGLGSVAGVRDAVAVGTDVGLLGRLWLAEVKLTL